MFKCGWKLKDTNFEMFEDIQKELHELWKVQMDKLKKARKEGKRAYFSKHELRGEIESLRKAVFFFWKGSIVFHFWSMGEGFSFFFSSLLAVFFCFSVKLVWVFGIRNFFFSLLFLFMDLSAFCIVC